ncbi:uncharacterized protein LOC127093955 [Lathyrus oleraceus]|uniref:uncharacterized protein LOC127093955 n=1 Tax=Pisum sativum TaxID=3888 RepID=UPI0021D1A9DF|nr:uncharacterized protein LOC127093955 [Pisum sativum]
MAMALNSSVVIKNMVIPKLNDLRSFSIHFHIGTMDFERALCDLGPSASLMPLFVCNKLDMGDMKPTNVSLQLADGSIKYPIDVLKDVPLRVGKHYVLVDFVIMDIDEDFQIPIILGAVVRVISPVKLSYLNIGSGHVKNVVGGCMEEVA